MLIVRCFACEVPYVMGPLRPVWAARRARWRNAISVSFLVSQALARVLSGTPRSYEWWVYKGSVRPQPRHAPSPRALPSRLTHSRSRSERAGAQVPSQCHGSLARCLTRSFPRETSRKSANGCHWAGSASRRDLTEHDTKRGDLTVGKRFWDEMIPATYGLNG